MLEAMSRYALGQIGWAIVDVALGLAFTALVLIHDWGQCPKCGRKRQWRWRKPDVYAKRRYCVFHEV